MSDPTTDLELCRSLEADAEALERLATAGESYETLAKRRSLLVQLDTTGFFEPEVAGRSSSASALRDAGCPVLSSYVAAAGAVLAYLGGDARRTRPRLSAIAAISVLSAPVSVDWFRSRWARGLGDDEELLAAAEELLDARADRLPPDATGEVIRSDRAETRTLRWRREDGVTPAVVSYDTDF